MNERIKVGFKPTGHNCCAFDCNHKSASSTCSFLSFPKDKVWREVWVSAIKRCAIDNDGKVLNKLWQPDLHHRLCSCHFSVPPKATSRKIGWNHVVPDLLPGVRSKTPRSTRKSTSRDCGPVLKKRRLCRNVCTTL